MSYVRRIALATAVIGLGFGLAAPAVAEVKIKIGTTVPEGDNPQTRAFRALAEYVSFRSGGEMSVEVFYGGALGGDRELLEEVQNNTLQMTVVADGAVANFFPDIQVVAIPYLFSSTNHALTFFNTSPFFQEMAQRMEKDTGLKILMAAESGFRNITNNAKPIKTPADMAGLKMRTMESPVFMELMRSVGAAPTPIAFNETILALRQGVVDGQENAVATVRMFGVWEVQKYMSINEHIYSPGLVTTNADVLERTDRTAASDLQGWRLRLGDRFELRLHRQLQPGHRVPEGQGRRDLRQHAQRRRPSSSRRCSRRCWHSSPSVSARTRSTPSSPPSKRRGSRCTAPTTRPTASSEWGGMRSHPAIAARRGTPAWARFATACIASASG